MENAAALPALHTIAYPEKYKPHLHEGGASFFAGKTDHPNFRYYVFNDYYNMECDDTLYNLNWFQCQGQFFDSNRYKITTVTGEKSVSTAWPPY